MPFNLRMERKSSSRILSINCMLTLNLTLDVVPSVFVAAVAGSIGYGYATYAARNPRRSPRKVPPSEEDSDDAGGTTSESEDEDDKEAFARDLGSIHAGAMEEMKLVLVINEGLKMTKGKIAAQAGHATLACYETLSLANPVLLQRWKRQGSQAKVAVKCANTEELEQLAAQARSLNLCARTIQDAGRTQVKAGSKTVLGIGPGPVKLINQVTGKLKLL
ncbi:peptidyl-tRNA hydrolase, PTH2 family, partial [Tremellales sp. Uapishka_1]